MIKQFAEQVAVITGAGSGIGKAIALALGEQGARLVLIGRRPGPLESVAEGAREVGAEARVCPADMACVEDIRVVAAKLRRDFTRCDVLVHSAGIHLRGSVGKAPVEELDLHHQTNVRGPYLLTQELLPMLLERRGQIVFVNSSAGLISRANIGQFAATKHGLKAIADSLRDEVNPHGVRVLSVYPGRTATPNQQRLHELEQRPYRPERLMQPEDVAAVTVHALCLPRTAEVTEIKIRPMLKFD
jgi:NAD(P)-dependent dehydrogenase (short-subunit alcohol dehydrogenase family)